MATHSSILAGKSHGQRNLWATVSGAARNQAGATEHTTWSACLPGIPHVCLALSDKFNITYIHLELQSWQMPCHTCED